MQWQNGKIRRDVKKCEEAAELQASCAKFCVPHLAAVFRDQLLRLGNAHFQHLVSLPFALELALPSLLLVEQAHLLLALIYPGG